MAGSSAARMFTTLSAVLTLVACDGYARVYGVVRRVPCGGGSPFPVQGARISVLQEGHIRRGTTATDEQGAFDRFLLTGAWSRRVQVRLTIERAGCKTEVITTDALPSPEGEAPVEVTLTCVCQAPSS